VLTPSPSRATRLVAAIICGAEHLIREAVSDEDHFAIVDFDRALDHALDCNLSARGKRVNQLTIPVAN
jgi:hypothetical protein